MCGRTVHTVEGEPFPDDSVAFALQAAGLGWWDLDITRNHTTRSALHDALFGYDQMLPSWGYEDFLAHLHDEDRDRVDAVRAGLSAAGGSVHLPARGEQLAGQVVARDAGHPDDESLASDHRSAPSGWRWCHAAVGSGRGPPRVVLDGRSVKSR